MSTGSDRRSGGRKMSTKVSVKKEDEFPVKTGWFVDIVVGGIVGGVAGAIVAVNFIIYAGIDRGYEATIPEVFRQSVVAGVVTVAVLVAGPVVGVWIARRLRRRRSANFH
jgi:uncharacterized membrane protein